MNTTAFTAPSLKYPLIFRADRNMRNEYTALRHIIATGNLKEGTYSIDEG